MEKEILTSLCAVPEVCVHLINWRRRTATATATIQIHFILNLLSVHRFTRLVYMLHDARMLSVKNHPLWDGHTEAPCSRKETRSDHLLGEGIFFVAISGGIKCPLVPLCWTEQSKKNKTTSSQTKRSCEGSQLRLEPGSDSNGQN